jgi:hypothetical protein
LQQLLQAFLLLFIQNLLHQSTRLKD